MSSSPPPSRPLLVAHRAGNQIATLRAAEAAGVDLIEVDVWWYRGRLEVRHLKTMGPIPLLWDRWKLASAWAPRMTLDELLEAPSPTTELMFDLKGHAPELAPGVIEAVRRLIPGRPYTVSSPSWDVLEAFHGEAHARVIYSVGRRAMLRKVSSRLARHEHRAVTVHRRLLSPARVASLREMAPTVMSWPINTPESLHEVLAWGVNGIVSDNIELLGWLVRERADSA